ncbi:MAG: DedA family protein [Gammaproteobacteria bacterium]|nr:DedA family protein [Gammaproteobacteria bacterium]
MFESFIEWLTGNPEYLGIGIAFTACVESFFVVGIIVPGVAILFAAAAAGAAADISAWPLMAWAAAGAICGDTISYFLGRFFGMEARHLGWMQKHQEKWDKAHDFFVRYGMFAIVAGRFIGLIRPVMPTVAGAAGMPRRVFIATDLLSALAWAPLYILPGYYGAEWFLAV